MNQKFILSPFVKLERNEQFFWFLTGSKQVLIEYSPELFKSFICYFHFLKIPRTKKEINFYLESLDSDDSELLEKYTKNKPIWINETYLEGSKYNRHHLFYNYSFEDISFQEVQTEISSKKIMIIGCGGIGSNIASVLTTSGFHNFILVDDDLIEESNLTRQYPFCYNDLEKPKVDILENYLRARNPDLKVKKYKKRITKIRDLEELPSCDLIVLSADSIGITKIVNSYAVRTKTALLPVGYMGDLAVVGPFYIPHKSSCLACRSKEKSFGLDVMKEVEKINILFQPPSFGPLNLMAVSFSSSEIIRYFSQQSILSVNRKVGLSLKDLVVRFVDYEPDEACLCYES